METFVTAYLVVWFAVLLYVARMGLRQRRLQHSLDELQTRMRQQADGSETPASAA